MILRLRLLLVLLATSYTVLKAQQDTTYAEFDFQKSFAIYDLATQFNDPVIARMALYDILLMTDNQTAILDSLALNYFTSRRYISAALVAQENVKINKRNAMALEIGAVSFANIGAKEKALDFYEDLALLNDKIETHYQVAFLQFELKRYTEAKTTIDFMMNKKGLDTSKIVFPKVDNSSQEVSMKAALYNLNGLILEGKSQAKEAMEWYLKATQEQPGFELAQLNIKRVKDTMK